MVAKYLDSGSSSWYSAACEAPGKVARRENYYPSDTTTLRAWDIYQVLKKKDSLISLARAKEDSVLALDREAERRYKSERAKTTALLEDVSKAGLFLPYPLFLFLRSLRWAWRQAKREQAS